MANKNEMFWPTGFGERSFYTVDSVEGRVTIDELKAYIMAGGGASDIDVADPNADLNVPTIANKVPSYAESGVIRTNTGTGDQDAVNLKYLKDQGVEEPVVGKFPKYSNKGVIQSNNPDLDDDVVNLAYLKEIVGDPSIVSTWGNGDYVYAYQFIEGVFKALPMVTDINPRSYAVAKYDDKLNLKSSAPVVDADVINLAYVKDPESLIGQMAATIADLESRLAALEGA